MPEIMVRFDDLRRYCEKRHCGSVPIEYIKEMPTIEAEPVRHGRFVFQKGDNKETVDGWICTACKYGFHTKVPYYEVFKYCPMCGARMDGGADNG